MCMMAVVRCRVGNDSDVHSRCGTNYMSSGLGEASMI